VSVPEAPVASTEIGAVPQGMGWFVLNARDARWLHTEGFGSWCEFEGEDLFPQLAVNLTVLRPGEPKGLYHAENAQEDFLVLAGECLLVVDGRERALKPWDFFHCPPGTEHVLIGAGDGPCAILAAGARPEGPEVGVRYPVDGAALAHGAGVAEETSSPQEANATLPGLLEAAQRRPELYGRYREGDLPA
jgi:uncharacterized cupin superfamily protein